MHIPLPPLPDGWPRLLPGWVWLVGAGPGDPGLVTLHALNALAQAEVVVLDALVAPEILAWVRPGAAIETMGKRGGLPSPTQDRITDRLIALARGGARVVRLKGGDPFVFGRGGEEAVALVRAGIPVRVVPGISAGIGGLAYAGIPVTDRDLGAAVTLVSGHDQTGALPEGLDWAAMARACPVIVAYMAVRTLPAIAAALIGGGRNPGEPVAIVTDATRPNMRVLRTTLGRAAADLAANGLGSPAIICIGAVVRLADILAVVAPLAAAAPGALSDVAAPADLAPRPPALGAPPPASAARSAPDRPDAPAPAPAARRARPGPTRP